MKIIQECKKCKYIKTCKLYDKDSKTCNQTGGKYYGDRYSGCYIIMEKK